MPGSTKRRNLKQPLWLSAVVLEELYVGANNEKLKELLARLEKDFERAGWLLVPLQSNLDGMRAGAVPSQGEIRLRTGGSRPVSE
jgi:hypothetical protein